jgi:hypothetical protein
MGQANYRGSREDRIRMAIERDKLKAIVDAEDKERVRQSFITKANEDHAALEVTNAERVKRGEQPLAIPVVRRTGRRTGILSALVAAAAMSRYYR